MNKSTFLTNRNLFIAAVIGLLLIVVFGVSKVDKHTIEITQEEVQAKIDEKIKEGLQGRVKLVNLRITDAKVELMEHQIKLNYTVQLSSEGLKLGTLKADASGNLRYHGGGFYLHQANFRFLDLRSDSLAGKIGGEMAKKTLSWAKNKVGEKIGVNLSENPEALKEEGILWLQNLVTEKLERHPVYRFKGNFWGVVISSALHEDGLEIQDGKILVHISYWAVAFGFIVGGFVVMVILFLLAVFVLRPRLILGI